MPRRTVRDLCGGVALTLPLLIAAGAQARQAAPDVMPQTGVTSVDDIVVTASKRSEALKDVPLSLIHI